MAATLRSRIEAYSRDWRPILGLQDWRIIIHYDERCKEKFGYCIAQPCYEEAVIGLKLSNIRKLLIEDDDLEELVLHELVHCVIWKTSERAVTQMTRALLRARYPGRARWAL